MQRTLSCQIHQPKAMTGSSSPVCSTQEPQQRWQPALSGALWNGLSGCQAAPASPSCAKQHLHPPAVPAAHLTTAWAWLDLVCVLVGYTPIIPGVADISGLRAFRALRPLRTINAYPGVFALQQRRPTTLCRISEHCLHGRPEPQPVQQQCELTGCLVQQGVCVASCTQVAVQ